MPRSPECLRLVGELNAVVQEYQNNGVTGFSNPLFFEFSFASNTSDLYNTVIENPELYNALQGVLAIPQEMQDEAQELTLLAIRAARGDTDAQQELVQRGGALYDTLTNIEDLPKLVYDHYKETFEEAQRLEDAGKLDEAEQLRAQATAEMASIFVGGAAGIKVVTATGKNVVGKFTSSNGGTYDVPDAPKGGVPDDWKPISSVGAQVNTPTGFTSYIDADGNIFHVSPSGLKYGYDPEFGNRVDHVLDHTHPNPNKLKHTVFNVQGDDALALVDEAWENRGAPVPNDPQAFVVDMGRPVGTNGETKIRVVVDPVTNEITTAYPQ